MASIQVYLFGTPRIERDGVPVPLERRKALALLAYLAVSGQPQGRDTLAALLWPDLDQQHARAALRPTLVALHQALGGDWLSAEQDRIALATGPGLEVDAVRFRALLAAVAAHDHVPARLCDTCLAALREAAELCRGDFLAGFTLQDAVEFDDWQSYQAEAFRRELAGALEKLALVHAAPARVRVGAALCPALAGVGPPGRSGPPDHHAALRLGR